MSKAACRRLIALTLAALVVAATGASSALEHRTSAGTVVVAQGVDPDHMDPIAGGGQTVPSGNVLGHVFDTLVKRSPDGDFIPWLATSWKPIDDRSWEFRLRQGVKFHNGEPFDAQSVKFTFERIYDPRIRRPSMADDYSLLETVEIVDKYTVRLITKVPFPTMLANLAKRPPMVPPKYTRQSSNEHVAKFPVGTGPYRFVEWIPGTHVILEANPEFWGKAPDIKRLVFRPIPEPGTRAAELITGGVDVITDVTPDLVPVIKGSKTATIASTPSFRILYLYFTSTGDSDTGPLADKRVRQAMYHAIDFKALTEDLLQGFAEPVATGVTPDEFGYDPNIAAYQYSPKRARELLIAAGYPNGFSLTMASPSGRYMNDREVAEAIVGMLGNVGIKVTLNFKEWGVMSAERISRTIKEGMFLLGSGNTIRDADFRFYGQLHGSSPLSYFHHQEFDRLIDRARSITDQAERQKLYSQALRILQDEVPWIPLYRSMALYGISNRLDWAGSADEEVWLYPERLR
jgi:peptide/nickel transport system substrate-binding protein